MSRYNFHLHNDVLVGAIACVCLLNGCNDKDAAEQTPSAGIVDLDALSRTDTPGIVGKGTSAHRQPASLTGASSLHAQLAEVYRLDKKGNLAEALQQIDVIVDTHPREKSAYSLRAEIYSEQKEWDKARLDYETILTIDPANTLARFDLAELQFKQKQYGDARQGFVALESGAELGDLASYKVFLCDLFSGDEVSAKSELVAFNQAGSNASYYFANAAWSLFHDKPDDAQSWLNSASFIYSPDKISRYSSSLIDLGYLPLAGTN